MRLKGRAECSKLTPPSIITPSYVFLNIGSYELNPKGAAPKIGSPLFCRPPAVFLPIVRASHPRKRPVYPRFLRCVEYYTDVFLT